MYSMKQYNQNSRRFHVLTYGCTFNQGDSAKIIEIMKKNGFFLSNLENSDIIIINTCAVKHATEAKILDFIRRSISINGSKFFIITGCLPLIDKKIFNIIEHEIGNRGFILHPHQIAELSLLLQQNKFITKSIANEIFHPIRDKSFLLPSLLNSNMVQIQISEGCNNSCTYCCTTIARGKLISFNDKQIVQQIEYFSKKGVKEFHLTSQDLGNYNFQGLKLHDLLFKISEIKGQFKVRLGMLNPEYIVKNGDEFLKIFEDNRFFRFLHIPIQSGSNRILKLMKRDYTVEDMEQIILNIEKFDENFTFSTDIITGFPTETEDDFVKTIEIIKKWKPMILNISKYSVRPNTKAKLMPQLKSQIIKERSKKLSTIYQKYSKKKLANWIGWNGKVFIDEYRSGVKYPYMGRNLYYLPVLCKEGKIGNEKSVIIKDYLNHVLVSE